MNFFHFRTHGSSSHAGSVGFFMKFDETTPIEFSKPAGLSTPPTEIDANARMLIEGFQPISTIRRIACAAVRGVAKFMKASAPESLSVAICESTVGSVGS